MQYIKTVTKLISDEILAERSFEQCIRELDSSQSPVRYFLAEHNLQYADRMGMANSIEIRVPLLDLELRSRALKSSVTTSILKPKAQLNRAAKNLVPDYILNRKKEGFGIPDSNCFLEPAKNYYRQIDAVDLNRRLNDVFPNDHLRTHLKLTELMRRHSISLYGWYVSLIWIMNTQKKGVVDG